MSALIESPIKRLLLAFLLCAFGIGALASHPAQARAASGMPDSPEFGYGGRLDLWGSEVELALKAAASIGLDWLGVDFDWARHWPDPNIPPDLHNLDQGMALAQNYHLNVSIAITHPPDWTMTADGPDAQQTAELALMLAQRYAPVLHTIELLAGANTRSGWGAPPNPRAYAALYQTVQTALRSAGSPVVLVAAGLTPVPSTPSVDYMDDLLFLNQLYQAGAAAYMPIISLRLNQVQGDAMTPPRSDVPTLRHYEEVRQVMLRNHHANGLIWITAFTWPAQIAGESSTEAIRWLDQALRLMKSQLYIGAAFYQGLNPSRQSQDMPDEFHPLIETDGQGVHLHPALIAMGQIITLNQSGHGVQYPPYLIKRIALGATKGRLKVRVP